MKPSKASSATTASLPRQQLKNHNKVYISWSDKTIELTNINSRQITCSKNHLAHYLADSTIADVAAADDVVTVHAAVETWTAAAADTDTFHFDTKGTFVA